MLEGLWVVQYEGVHGNDGGVVVFVRGNALGGDNAFVYTGTYQSDGNTISARILVRNFNPDYQNVLGIKGDFELLFEGKTEVPIMRLSATLLNQEGPGLVAKLTKVHELAI